MRYSAKNTAFFMLLFLFSCTTVSTYPLSLSYLSKIQAGKKENRSITVALFNDKRMIMDQRFLGKKDNKIIFISLPEAPAGINSHLSPPAEQPSR